MSQCLITTLKEAVQDESLLTLDEIRFHYSAKNNAQAPMWFGYSFGQRGMLRIISEGYITDTTGTQNLGRTCDVLGDRPIYLSKGNYYFTLSNKYNFNKLTVNQGSAQSDYAEIAFDLKDILVVSASLQELSLLRNSGVEGDIAILNKFTDLKKLSLNSPKVYGNISVLQGMPLTELRLFGSTKIDGDISSLSDVSPNITMVSLTGLNVTGNINVFAGKTSLIELSLNSTGVEGNINSLAGLTSLRQLNLSNTNLTGDTSSLRNLTNLTTFTYANTAITGTWPLT